MNSWKCAFLCICLVASICQGSQIYRWVDESGSPHFSTKLPPRSCQSDSCKKLRGELIEVESENEVATIAPVENDENLRRKIMRDAGLAKRGLDESQKRPAALQNIHQAVSEPGNQEPLFEPERLEKLPSDSTPLLLVFAAVFGLAAVASALNRLSNRGRSESETAVSDEKQLRRNRARRNSHQVIRPENQLVNVAPPVAKNTLSSLRKPHRHSPDYDRSSDRDFLYWTPACIKYCDRQEVLTERDIRINYETTCGYMIDAFCELRQARRTFLVERIERLIDLRTGEVASSHPGIDALLDDMMSRSPMATFLRLLDLCGDEVNVLVFVAKADDRVTKEENQVFQQYMLARLDDAFPELSDEMRECISRYMIMQEIVKPKVSQVKKSLRECAKSDCKQRVLTAAREVAQTRKSQHEFLDTTMAMVEKALA